MKRILLMVITNIIFAPYWFIKICIWAKSDKHTVEEKFNLLKHICIHANKGGKVKIISHGIENIPKENGFIMYPNHQGLYDVLAFIESCPNPFTVINKKEVQNIPFLKQIFIFLKAITIDREDIRQSMLVIKEVADKVKEGTNFIIFAEGTRSKKGNQLLDFKGGSFKSAVYAKCPIVPVAIIDAYKPFDTNTISKVNVQIHYLEPILYDDYKNMKTTEIASLVKSRIEKKIEIYEKAYK